jgi:hypothetical protein
MRMVWTRARVGGILATALVISASGSSVAGGPTLQEVCFQKLGITKPWSELGMMERLKMNACKVKISRCRTKCYKEKRACLKAIGSDLDKEKKKEARLACSETTTKCVEGCAGDAPKPPEAKPEDAPKKEEAKP